MVSIAQLRNRTGYQAWREWYDGLGDWTDWGPRNPQVRPNVPRSITLSKPQWWLWREQWWRAWRESQQPKPIELVGVIRTAGNCTVDHEAARAFLAAGGDRVMLQFRDAQDAINRAQFPEWAARWRAAGVRVSGWWRVNQSPSNTPPAFLGPDDWWPNAEDNDEVARLPLIYQAPCAGVLCRGKQPGAWPPAGGLMGAECFRENPSSDHTVANSVRFWLDAGLPLARILALLQAYGTPFASLAEQARQAKQLGVGVIGIYPLDGADPAAVRALGQVIA